MNSSESIGIIIEARLTSSRLPKKHLLEVLNKPILSYLIDRLKIIQPKYKIILAIPESENNLELEKMASELGILCFKGSENNVMQRVLHAAEYYDIDIVCEITGDCPLIDPALVSDAITFFLENNFEYISSGRTGIPDGMGVQIFLTNTLRRSYELAFEAAHFEHVTLHINENPDLFRIHYLETADNLKRSDLRLTLDTEVDFKLLGEIIEHFLPEKPFFNLVEILDYLDSKSLPSS
jgi:spore coat polysaccharide biosynthesis protein SpsF